MRNKLSSVVIGAVLTLVPLVAAAQTTDIQNQLNVLQAQIAALLQQLGTLQGGITTQTPQTTQTCPLPALYRNLSRGSSGPDVAALQDFLISRGYLAAGNITAFFGPLTEAAVQRFQSEQGIVSSGTPSTTGYGAVGPATRAVIAKICSTQTQPIVQQPVSQINPVTITSFTASLTQVAAGQPVMLNWSAVNAGSCNLAGQTPGLQATTIGTNLPGNGSMSVAPVNSTTYSLVCTSIQALGLGAVQTVSVTVTDTTPIPTPTPTLAITSPTGGSYAKGTTVTISWAATGTIPASGTVTFDLYDSANSRVGTIATAATLGSGNLQWRVPYPAYDGTCPTQTPNGLCGVDITPGSYTIKATVSNAVMNTVPSAAFTIAAGTPPAVITLSVTPLSQAVGSPLNIKWSVARAPTDSAIALWLLRSGTTTESFVSRIAQSLDAVGAGSTYPWTISSDTVPGIYKIVAKVYTPSTAVLASEPGTSATYLATATSKPITVRVQGSGNGACVVLTRDMGPNDVDADTDGEVSKLQEFLARDEVIYPEGLVSGFYGPATTRAVQRWQVAHHIVSSGTPDTTGYGAVGPRTRAAMTDCTGNLTFIATPRGGSAPLPVTFTAKSIDDRATYFVRFGDGTVLGQMVIAVPACSSTNCDTAARGIVSHIYGANGTYTATLIKQPPFVCNAPEEGAGCAQVMPAAIEVASVTINIGDDVEKDCAVFTRTMRPDDTDATTSGDVTLLQQFLAKDATIYPEKAITGFYGPATTRAVKRWQVAHGISTLAAGSVDASTLAAMRCDTSKISFSASTTTGAAPFTVIFTVGPIMDSAAASSYVIDFGDGSANGMLIPQICQTTGPGAVCPDIRISSHTYSGNGTYTAKLIYQPVLECTNGNLGACPPTPAPITLATLTIKVTGACTAITHDLQRGDSDADVGGDVTTLQNFLRSKTTFYPNGLMTGFYGAATEAAVKLFQKDRDILQTGFVGPVTRAAIKTVCEGGTSKTPYKFSATPVSGDAPLAVAFVATNVESLETFKYVVDFGDGARADMTEESDSSLHANHSYTSGGTFKARLLEVTELCGAGVTQYGCVRELQVDSVNITVTAPTPVISQIQISCSVESANSQKLVVTNADGSKQSFVVGVDRVPTKVLTTVSALPSNLEAFHCASSGNHFACDSYPGGPGWQPSQNRLTRGTNSLHLDSEDWTDNDWNDLVCDAKALSEGEGGGGGNVTNFNPPPLQGCLGCIGTPQFTTVSPASGPAPLVVVAGAKTRYLNYGGGGMTPYAPLGLSIEWGDGETTDIDPSVFSGKDLEQIVYKAHIYAAPGTYIAKLYGAYVLYPTVIAQATVTVK